MIPVSHPPPTPTTPPLLIHRLLDDITAQAAEVPHGAPAGLDELTAHPWPHGTVLSRKQLEAARDGRPYDQP